MGDLTAATEAIPRLTAAASLLTAGMNREWDMTDARATALRLARRAVAILEGTDDLSLPSGSR